MSASIDYPRLDKVTDTWALDTTDPTLGAPGEPGELRAYDHPTYGRQIYRLTLNESGSAIDPGHGFTLKAGSATRVSADALSGTGTVRQKFGGVAQVTVADDYWFWALVHGEGQLSCLTGSAQHAVLETAASGDFDDTAGTGLAVGFQTGATVGGATALADAFISVLS